MLGGYTGIPRDGDFDFLAEVEAVFAHPQPNKKVAAKKAQKAKAIPSKSEAPPKMTAKKAVAIKKKVAA